MTWWQPSLVVFRLVKRLKSLLQTVGLLPPRCTTQPTLPERVLLFSKFHLYLTIFPTLAAELLAAKVMGW
jgi:hypothetical protein